MLRVLPAALAKLLQLETTRDRLLVLRRRVVALLALRALHCDDFPHSVLPSQSNNLAGINRQLDPQNELPPEKKNMGATVSLHSNPYSHIVGLFDINGNHILADENQQSGHKLSAVLTQEKGYRSSRQPHDALATRCRGK
jgi:hypothetical protein